MKTPESRHEWMQQYADGTVSAEAIASLEQALRDDEAFRTLFLEYLNLDVALQNARRSAGRLEEILKDDEPRAAPHGQELADPLGGDFTLPFPPHDSSSLQCSNGAWHARDAKPTSAGWVLPWRALQAALETVIRMPWLARAAVLLLCVGGLWRASSSLRNAGQNVAVAPPADVLATDAPADSPASKYVARIVRVTPDVIWGDSGATHDFLLRLRPQETVRVTRGLVQVEFFSGAVIILQGPAVFTPTGTESGLLESGRLTGHVNNGNFRLKTSVAEVVDLGTAFGVAVDPAKGTDVLVFEGEVQVISNRTSPKPGEVLKMTEGMAARIRADGSADYGLQPDDNAFARSIVDSDMPEVVSEISLVDIVTGGNGLKSRLAGAIDPRTGQKEKGDSIAPNGDKVRPGDAKFHSAAWHPLIDGVFVPGNKGKKPVVDTLGHVVDLPVNAGATWGPIWARRWESTLEATDATPDFWGGGTLDLVVPRLRAAKFGIVGMHANVGITFNLRSICLNHHRPATAFQATLVNLDNVDEWDPNDNRRPRPTADFRVFVDGQLRYSRIDFCRRDGDDQIIVPLTPDDQRLTLISTDGEGNIRYDHVTLIDPMLVLADPAAEAEEP